MRIYFISPIGKKSDMLFETFVPTFESKGHIIVNDVKDADIVFFDMYDKKSEYEQRDLDAALILPKCVMDFGDYGGCKDGTETFPYIGDNKQIEMFLQRPPSDDIWFVRKLSKTDIYPKVFPIECCLYPDHDFAPVSKEDLFNRQYDIFFAGNESPTRKNVINGLLNSGLFKMDIHWSNEHGKLSHIEWLNRSQQAKFFLTSDGGGFSDERPYQLITISAMLKQRNNHLQLHEFNGGYNCIVVSENMDVCEYMSLQSAVSDKDMLYTTYLNGIEHMKSYYTYEYRANYILDTIQKHLNLL